MHLKRLEMFGFKSFAMRTHLEFSPGITAVVGPNGAGKSNVADAIRWVLGEQSMRQLRGKKSDDIIFIGGQGHAPLGMAEVALTLDNSTGWVPSEYSEITVTRRVYRSGENEYFINKQRVRLKDVLLLLAQARIGHDSYTVVGQGLIDAALSLRAEERRSLFEDAAGIRPFQVQRNDAEQRLKQTAQSIERLRDIVNEIAPRLEPLKEQAHRAVMYQQLSQELQEVLIHWYSLQWRHLNSVCERAVNAEQSQAQLVHQDEAELQSLDLQMQQLREERTHLQARMSDLRRANLEAQRALQQDERDLAVNTERITHLQQQQNDRQREEHDQREKLIAARRRLVDLEEQCDIADEALDKEAAQLAGLESEAANAQKVYTQNEHRLRAAQNELAQAQARFNSSRSDHARLLKRQEERREQSQSWRETCEQMQQALKAKEQNLSATQLQLDSLQEEIDQKKLAQQRVLAEIEKGASELEHMTTTQAEAERRHRTTSDRITMLNQWRHSLSGYSDGVRAILQAQAQAKTTLSGVLGPLPQLCVVPAGMEHALEAALGAYMQAVVVETLPQAMQVLRYLQQRKAGKAIVIWRERSVEDEESSEVRSLQAKEEATVLRRYLETLPDVQEQVIGFAWQVITCDDTYAGLFRRLLRGVVITRTLDAAYELLRWGLHLSVSSDTNLPFRSIVTLAGEVLHIDGWLADDRGSGGKGEKSQGLLAHERELRELPQQLKEIDDILTQVRTMIRSTQSEQTQRRNERNMIEADLQQCVVRKNGHEKSLRDTQREMERTESEISATTSLAQQSQRELAGIEQELAAALAAMKTHEKAQQGLTEKIATFQDEMEEHSVRYRSLQEELSNARTAHALKRQEARSLRGQLTQLQLQEQELHVTIQRVTQLVRDIEQRRTTLGGELKQQEQLVAERGQRVQRVRQQLQLAESQEADSEQRLSELEKQRAGLQQKARARETSYRGALLESQKARDAVKQLLTHLQEELEIEDAEHLLEREQQLMATPDNSAAIQKEEAQDTEDGDDDKTRIMPAVSTSTAIGGSGDMLTAEEETRLRRYRRQSDSLRSRMKKIGGYDSEAPQLYEETRIRHEFLSTQIADLEQAVLQLQSVIQRLDAMMAQQFESTFQAVNARFRENFTTLFNGGSARLELVQTKEKSDAEGEAEDEREPADPASVSTMPAGVDIIVQPPGKKMQDLALLSGGERAMVSAALLFSLLEINPPPFCLLDEVDAALDESNVTRFGDILKRLSQRTQFIVITHNRVTMTGAQAIYGVSMRESVSRLLSLRLDEVPVSGAH